MRNKIMEDPRVQLWIMVGCFILFVIFSGFAGYFLGKAHLCEANGGVMVGPDWCILDKCLENKTVCREGSTYYIRDDPLYGLNLTFGGDDASLS